MHPRRFALIGGLVMLAIGLISLVPAWMGSAESLPALYVETSYGLFLGLFAMNIFNKLALIGFGFAGLVAAYAPNRSLPASILYSRIVFAFMGVSAILGVVPQAQTLGGYWPLLGNNVLLNAAFSLLGGYFGFAMSSLVPKVTRGETDYRNPVHGTR